MKIARFMNEDNWTKGSLARNVSGDQVGSLNPEAVRWCLLGYVEKFYTYTPIERVLAKLYIALDKLHPGLKSLADFNEAVTFEEVRKVVEEAGV